MHNKIKLILLSAIIMLFLHACDIFDSKEEEPVPLNYFGEFGEEYTKADFHFNDDVYEMHIITGFIDEDGIFNFSSMYRNPTDKGRFFQMIGGVVIPDSIFIGVGEYNLGRVAIPVGDTTSNVNSGFRLGQLAGDVMLGRHVADRDYGSVLRITHLDLENNYLEGNIDALMVPDTLMGRRDSNGNPIAGKNSVLPDTVRIHGEFTSKIIRDREWH